VSSPIHVIQENAELEQVQVEDWEDEAFEDEAAEAEELGGVQHEIERLHKEQETIARRQATTQHAEAKRHHINRERARLEELQYIVRIVAPPKQRQSTFPTGTAYLTPTFVIPPGTGL
jgi:hypothetical protein